MQQRRCIEKGGGAGDSAAGVLDKMNTLPSDVVVKIYKYSHQMQVSKCMKQLKLYRVHCSLNVSWDFLESAHYVLNGVRIPCFDINNIEASSHSILNLIYYGNS